MDTLPDFDLAKLSEYPRDVLVARAGDGEVTRQAKESTLILGLCFNRLKDLHWALARVATADLTPEPISARNGQVFGMRASYTHLTVGTMFELAEAVKNRARVATLQPWKVALRRMPKVGRLAWQEVTSLATRRSGHQPLANYLWKVRDKVAHHFDGEALMAGYMSFFTSEAEPGSEAAYVSAGVNMEATRFYFADAAAINATKEFDRDVPWKAVDKFGRQVNFALRFLIEAMLKEFTSARVR